MKTLCIWSVAVGVIMTLPWTALADDGQAPRGVLLAQATAGQSIKTFAYQPPRKGTPATSIRRGGGTRGMNKSAPVISVLAPEHIGLTLAEQPDLYWHTPAKQDQAFEFMLIGENADVPIVETNLPAPVQPGIHQIKLSDHKVKLSPGERYFWSVTLIVDADEPSANIVAKGAIERIDPDKLETPLAPHTSPADAAKRYAEAGIWYDAVMALSDQIQSDPGNMDLRQQRASLLEQGGLTEVAANDLIVRAK